MSGKIQVTAENQPTDKHSFIKLISGFGGSNAAIIATREPKMPSIQTPKKWEKTHEVIITPTGVMTDGTPYPSEATGKALLTDIYRKEVGDYPKFFKMDMLSRLGFIASELLLKLEGKERFTDNGHRAVILFNHSSSMQTDTQYLESIKDDDNYFPSPSLFVYTLPNIVTGEIAIRNHYHGETSFFILAEEDEAQIQLIQQAASSDPTTDSMITGWLDYEDEQNFKADIYILDTRT